MEFVEGGLIDTSTEAKRRKGNMPAHNCNNEGLLGGWHQFSRESPSTTVRHFTDRTMFNHNKTQGFIDDNMTTEEEDQVEKTRQVELNAHKLAAVEAKWAKDSEKAEKACKEKERLGAIGIEMDHTEIAKMTDPKLKDQLELHRQAGDKEVPLRSKLNRKADRLTALLAAVDRLDSTVAMPASV
ncbi:hypothetical protein DFH08DRAFT_962311 [Mycena albidolilacea]|uniref:Uncharacterized protein n=1 Tax=Mycena albidolilacea TaxID=1033008 RepID=A0AAD7EQL6_9AGAR|nr:hypothetical protein DFH08DRAFT_962311 [Mycena albidolilacea]